MIGSLLATLVFQVQGQGVGDMMWYMTIARGITGVGVGGEYPPSAAAALEGSNEVCWAVPQESAVNLRRIGLLTTTHSITITSEDPSKYLPQP